LKKAALYIILIVLIQSCCSEEFDELDFMLSADEQIYATHYKIRDVIYFQNSKKEVDSIIISSIDTSTHFGGDCFISAAPGRHISI